MTRWRPPSRFSRTSGGIDSPGIAVNSLDHFSEDDMRPRRNTCNIPTNNRNLRLFAGLLAFCPVVFAQSDPGPRGGPPGAGNYYPTLNLTERALFNQALTVFNEVDS